MLFGPHVEGLGDCFNLLQSGKISGRQMGDNCPPFISDINWEFGGSC